MTPKQQREQLGLTQAQAAGRAGVSLPTWRRWEADPGSVSARSAAKCRMALEAAAQGGQWAVQDQARRDLKARIVRVWAHGVLTPRQAFAVMVSLVVWAAVDLKSWLEHGRGPLDHVGPFAYFDRRALVLVGETKVLATTAMERCLAIYDALAEGALPVRREGGFLDEVLMAAALRRADELLRQVPQLFEDLPEHRAIARGLVRDDADGVPLGDDDWSVVTNALDDLALAMTEAQPAVAAKTTL